MKGDWIMKKHMTFALAAAFTLAAFFYFNVAAVGNLVKNPDFSLLSPVQLPLHWDCRTRNLAGIKTLPEKTLKLEVDKKENAITVTQTFVKLEAMKSYELTWEARSARNSAYRFYCEWITGDGTTNKQWRGSGSSIRKTSKDFEKQNIVFMLPDKFNTVYIAICLHEPGELEIRNVSLVPHAGTVRRELGGTWELKGKCAFVKDGEREVVSVTAGRGSSAILRGVPVKAGKKYRLGFSVRGMGNAGNSIGFHGFQVLAIANPDALTRQMSGGKVRAYAGHMESPWDDVWNNSFQNKQFVFTVPAASNAVNSTIDLYCIAITKGAVLFRDFTFEEVPADQAEAYKMILTSPGYRNMIYASLPIGEIGGEITSDDRSAVKAKIKFGGNVYDTKVENKRFVFNFPAKDLKPGKYELTAEIFDASGKTLKILKEKIIKLPPAKVEVVVGPDLNLYINGKVFFPILFFGVPPDDVSYHAARQGVNCVLFGAGVDEGTLLDALDSINRYGIKAFVRIGYPASTDEAAVTSWKNRLYGVLTQKVREHPALLGYFTWDEPYWCGVPFKSLLAAYNFCKELDPYRPVWCNEAPRGEISIHELYSQAADIYGCDIYPVPYPSNHSGLEDKGLTSVGKYADRMSQGVGRRKPILMVLQGGYQPGRPPTYEETRFMTFDAMLNHCNAISYYSLKFITNPEIYDILCRVTSEFHRLSGLFTLGRIVDDANADAPAIRCRVIAYAGKKYLVAANTSEKPVSATISGQFNMPELTVFPDGRKVQLVNGSFKEDFKPFEVFVYGEAPLPPPVNELPAVNPEIDKLGNPFHLYLENQNKMQTYETKSDWIWEKTGANDVASKAFMGKIFAISKPVKSAKLNITIDDVGSAWLNGVEIGKGGGWSVVKTFDCSKTIKKGDNFLYVAAQDAGHLPCGALIELFINYTDGSIEQIISDRSWLASADPGDPNRAESISNWPPAVIVAPYGSGAWKKIKIAPEK